MTRDIERDFERGRAIMHRLLMTELSLLALCVLLAFLL